MDDRPDREVRLNAIVGATTALALCLWVIVFVVICRPPGGHVPVDASWLLLALPVIITVVLGALAGAVTAGSGRRWRRAFVSGALIGAASPPVVCLMLWWCVLPGGIRDGSASRLAAIVTGFFLFSLIIGAPVAALIGGATGVCIARRRRDDDNEPGAIAQTGLIRQAGEISRQQTGKSALAGAIIGGVGPIIGGIVGPIIGAIGAVLLLCGLWAGLGSPPLDPQVLHSSVNATALRGALVGALVGGLVGILVGARVRR